MTYKVKFTYTAYKDFKRIDRPVTAMLIKWIENNLKDIDDPFKPGKPLIKKASGKCVYKLGFYRILAEIKEKEILIFAVNAVNRRDMTDLYEFTTKKL